MSRTPLLEQTYKNCGETAEVLKKLQARVDDLERGFARQISPQAGNERCGRPDAKCSQDGDIPERSKSRPEGLSEESIERIREEAGFILSGHDVDNTGYRMFCTHGHIPQTSFFDFDMCFLFQLPRYKSALKREAKSAEDKFNNPEQNTEHSLLFDNGADRLKKLADKAQTDEKKLFEEFKKRLVKEGTSFPTSFSKKLKHKFSQLSNISTTFRSMRSKSTMRSGLSEEAAIWSGTLTFVAPDLNQQQVETAVTKSLRKQFGLEREDCEISAEVFAGTWTVHFLIHVLETQMEGIVSHAAMLEENASNLDGHLTTELLELGVSEADAAVQVHFVQDDGELLEPEEKKQAQLLFTHFTEPLETGLEFQEDIHSFDGARACAIEMLLQTLHSKELDYYTWMFTSVDRDELFVCAMMHDHTAKSHAYQSRYRLPLSSDALMKKGSDRFISTDTLQLKKGIDHPDDVAIDGSAECLDNYDIEGDGDLNINLDLEEGEEKRFNSLGWLSEMFPAAGEDKIYNIPASVEYDGRIPNSWFKKHRREHCDVGNEQASSAITKIDTLRLMYDQISDVMDIDGMKRNLVLKDWFPLHTPRVIVGEDSPYPSLHKWGSIHRSWYKFKHPVDEIRMYFGETIALYFCFVEELVHWTLVLALASLVVIVTDFSYCWPLYMKGDIKHWISLFGGSVQLPHLRVAFSLFTIAWCKLFSVFLTRKINSKLCRWGQLPHYRDEVKPVICPAFRENTTLRKWDIDSNRTEYGVEYEKKLRGTRYSNFGTMGCQLCGSIVIYVFLHAQTFFRKNNMEEVASIVSICMTAEIKIFVAKWPSVCKHFVNFEYHPSLTARSDAVAKKTFSTLFINTLCTFYYTAFIMPLYGDPALEDWASSWEYVCYLLFSTYLQYAAFSITDLVSPAANCLLSLIKEENNMNTASLLPKGFLNVNCIEYQSKLSTYDHSAEIDDFMELLLPLGFILCFGLVLPIGIPIALLTFLLSTRVDAWKLMTVFRRPYPYRVHSQWVWSKVINNLLNIAALTNIGLLSFVMAPFSDYRGQFQLLMFLGLVAAYLTFCAIVDTYLEDQSEAVKFTFMRHQHQLSRLNSWYRRRTSFMRSSESKVPTVLKPGQIKLNTWMWIPGVYVQKTSDGVEEEQGAGILEALLDKFLRLIGVIEYDGVSRTLNLLKRIATRSHFEDHTCAKHCRLHNSWRETTIREKSPMVHDLKDAPLAHKSNLDKLTEKVQSFLKTE